MIVVDPHHELAGGALHQAVKPGAAWRAAGLLGLSVRCGKRRATGVASSAEGLDALRSSLTGIDIEAEALAAGWSRLLREAAEAYRKAATGHNRRQWGMGLSFHRDEGCSRLKLLDGAQASPDRPLSPFYTATPRTQDMGVGPGEEARPCRHHRRLDDGSVSFLYVVGRKTALALATRCDARYSGSCPPSGRAGRLLTDTAAYAQWSYPRPLYRDRWKASPMRGLVRK